MTFGEHPSGPEVESLLYRPLHRAHDTKKLMGVPRPPITKPGNRTVKGRRSLPKADERRVALQGHDPYAYTFSDSNLGELKVLNSENGWWVGDEGRQKVQRLIEAWKIDGTDDDAMFYAGVSRGQLEYFQKLHPGVYVIKHLCKQYLGLHAKKKYAEAVISDAGAAVAYLRMKRKDEGYTERSEIAGANGRDLFDGLTQEIKKLGEELRNQTDDEEHTSDTEAGDADAGPDGAGDETSAPADLSPAPQVPPEAR
jgi:hypothetical protein